MGSRTGTQLKHEGVVICKNKRNVLIEWKEPSGKKRTFYYLVTLIGVRYTKPVKIYTRDIEDTKRMILSNKEK